MIRLVLAVVSLVFFFGLGLAGSSALRTPGTYGELRSSASVTSGELTLHLDPTPTPNPYEVPVQCQSQTYAKTVYLDELGVTTYTAEDVGELIFGTNGDDRIYGGAGDDCIVARGGHDFVFAVKGFDYIFGGDGDDVLVGDPTSFIDGGPGDDFCTPSSVATNCRVSGPENVTLAAHHSVPTIDIAWEPVSYAAYFGVYRSKSVDGPYALIGTSYDASYSDVGVGEDTVYYYRATAFFGSGSGSDVESDPSEPQSAMVPSGTLTPTATAEANAPTATPIATSTSEPTAAAPTATSTPVATSTPTATPTPEPAAPTAEPETSTPTTVP